MNYLRRMSGIYWPDEKLHAPKMKFLPGWPQGFLQRGISTLELEANWSAEVENGSLKLPDDGSDWCGAESGNTYRVAHRFDISSLPAGATIVQVDYSLNVGSVSGVSSQTWDIGPYGGDGQDDPESDSASTMSTRCDVSSDNYINNTTEFRTTGAKSFTLGSVANTDLENANAAPGSIFSLGIRGTDETGTQFAAFDEYSDGTAANRPILTIQYTV